MSYTDSDIDELGTKPISQDRPAGRSARYNPDFERLQSEIQKMNSLSGGIVEWKEVVELAISILSNESKDMLAAGYLCLGLFHLEGCKGLKAGLSCYRKLLENFWDELFPEIKRMRGRIGAVTWLSERIGAAVIKVGIKADEKKDANACHKEIKALTALLDKRFQKDSPGLGDLSRAIEEALRNITLEERPEKGKEAISVSKPSIASITEVKEIGSTQDALRILRETLNSIRSISSYLRGKDITDPISYRLIRIMAWVEICELPSNVDNRTMIPPIQRHITALCRELTEKENWHALLDFCETNITETPFWLDLNYYSMLALSCMGQSCKKAEQAVTCEFANLIHRLPGLLELQFSDGVPFATEDTRLWIENHLIGSSMGSLNQTVPTSQDTNEENNRIKDIKSKAKSLASEGKLKDAITLFQQELSGISRKREQFIIRLELAKISFEAGEPRIAIPILDELDREIGKYFLEEWEPGLSFEVLHVLWRSLNRLLQVSKGSSEEYNQQIRRVYNRLCLLDPVSALELNKKKKSSLFGR